MLVFTMIQYSHCIICGVHCKITSTYITTIHAAKSCEIGHIHVIIVISSICLLPIFSRKFYGKCFLKHWKILLYLMHNIIVMSCHGLGRHVTFCFFCCNLHFNNFIYHIIFQVLNFETYFLDVFSKNTFWLSHTSHGNAPNRKTTV